MDPTGFAVFIPIFALAIPVVGIIFHGLDFAKRLLTSGRAASHGDRREGP